MPELPPWLQPANEAQYMAEGLQLGASSAAVRAAQSLREQEMVRQSNIQQQEQARLEAQFQLIARQAAQKSQAQMQYQQAIQSGMDPLQALVQFGPQMGQPVTAAASAMRAMAPKPIPKFSVQDLPGGQKVVSSSTGGFRVVNPPEPVQTWAEQTTPSGRKYMLSSQGDMRMEGAPAKAGALTAVQTRQLMGFQKRQANLEKLIDKDNEPGSIYSMAASHKGKAVTDKDKLILDAHDKNVKELDDINKQINGIYDQAQGPAEPAEAPDAGDSGAQDLIEVTNPDQKRVRIRKSDLQSALANGYSQ
jgi:hypothetical protein